MLSLLDFVSEDLIFLNKKFEKRNELLEFVSKELCSKGYVKESFENAIKNREEVFPTGLDTGDIQVAIPHTDSEYVNKTAISILTLSKKVEFSEMSDKSNSVNAEIVFVLAVNDPKNQVSVLSRLMGILSNKELLLRIKNATDKNQVLKIVGEL